MSTSALLALAGAAVALALVSVLIDRVNFPQPRFRPRRVVYDTRGPHRDRTGAHVVVDVAEPRRRR